MSFRSHASFRAQTVPGGDHDLSTEFTERIVEGFRQRGVTCTDPESTTGACHAQITLDGSQLWLSVEELDTSGHHNWLVRLIPLRSGLLRRSSAKPLQKVHSTQVLHEILTDDLHVRPHWFSAEEWQDPRCEVGVTVPA